MRPWGRAAGFTFGVIAAFSATFAAPVAMAQTSAGQQTGTPTTANNDPGSPRAQRVEEDLIGTPRQLPTAPRAPSLSDLTHSSVDMSIEQIIASIAPRGSTTGPAPPDEPRLTSHVFRVDAELPLSRWLYVGGSWGFAAARGAYHQRDPSNKNPTSNDDWTTDPVHFISGQPQFFARVVRAVEGESYDVGAGLGVLLPLVTYDDLSTEDRLLRSTAASLVSIVRPWDVSTFLDRRVTTRPWIDMRTKNTRLVAQFRQALDIGYRTSGVCSATCDHSGDVQWLSISTLYLGWQPTHEVAVGVEVWETYLLKTALSVDNHSAVAVSPSLRFSFRWVEPAVSVLFPVGATLFNAADGYYAVRLDMRLWLGGR